MVGNNDSRMACKAQFYNFKCLFRLLSSEDELRFWTWVSQGIQGTCIKCPTAREGQEFRTISVPSVSFGLVLFSFSFNTQAFWMSLNSHLSFSVTGLGILLPFDYLNHFAVTTYQNFRHYNTTVSKVDPKVGVWDIALLLNTSLTEIPHITIL